MEQTLFEDYESRLKLDHILVGMRAEFEKHKEHSRKYLKDRYGIKCASEWCH